MVDFGENRIFDYSDDFMYFLVVESSLEAREELYKALHEWLDGNDEAMTLVEQRLQIRQLSCFIQSSDRIGYSL